MHVELQEPTLSLVVNPNPHKNNGNMFMPSWVVEPVNLVDRRYLNDSYELQKKAHGFDSAADAWMAASLYYNKYNKAYPWVLGDDGEPYKLTDFILIQVHAHFGDSKETAEQQVMEFI